MVPCFTNMEARVRIRLPYFFYKRRQIGMRLYIVESVVAVNMAKLLKAQYTHPLTLVTRLSYECL